MLEELLTSWTFLTNHFYVLLQIASNPDVRLREMAASIGITERAAHRILVELVEEGYVSRERQGRRNRYQVHPELPLRHPLLQQHSISKLLDALTPGGGREGAEGMPEARTAKRAAAG
jgi:DNA-binding IclR family transcriptional regulator